MVPKITMEKIRERRDLFSGEKKECIETSEKQKDDKSIAQKGRECKRKAKEKIGVAFL